MSTESELHVIVVPEIDWFTGPMAELRSRLETVHEQVKGRGRDYRNGRTKDRYHERARGVRLAIDELDKLLDQLPKAR